MSSAVDGPRGQRADPLIGAVLEQRYRVLRLLGEGAMGRVYEAVQLNLEQPVAIKVLHPDVERVPEVLARFKREALAASRAGNEHIVQVFDLGKLDNGEPFMALELLHGRDLQQELDAELNAGRTLPLERVAAIGCQLCEALSAAHARGIVHRDLKPSNVHLSVRGENLDFVKVLDFGVSKLRADPSDQKLTRTGAIIGTPLYMSPEQVAGRGDLDYRSDIFALGAILYHAVAGRPPFDRKELHALLYAIHHEPAPPLHELRPDLPRGFCDAVHRALEKDPAQRFRDCAELRIALAPYRASQTMPPPSMTPSLPVTTAPPAPSEPHPGAGPGVLIAALAVLIAVLAGAWWLRREPQAHVVQPAPQPEAPAAEPPAATNANTGAGASTSTSTSTNAQTAVPADPVPVLQAGTGSAVDAPAEHAVDTARGSHVGRGQHGATARRDHAAAAGTEARASAAPDTAPHVEQTEPAAPPAATPSKPSAAETAAPGVLPQLQLKRIRPGTKP